VETLGAVPDRAHDDAFGRLPVPGRDIVVDAVPGLAEPDEVRVRIQDDQPQRRLQQKPLQDRAEGVRLPRAGLSAEEGVAVEPAGVEPEAHARPEGQLTDVERRPARSCAFEPLGDGCRVRPRDRKVVERAPVAVEEDSVAASESDAVVRRIGHVRAYGCRQFRPFDPCRLDSMHLTEPAVDRGVAADFHREVVDRPLEREAPAVDRRGDGGHRGFE
jgi:hypothetical protein